MAVTRMARYMRTDVNVPAHLPQQSFAGYDAVIAAAGENAAALQQMSQWLAGKANEYATIAGAEYGAEHQPTAQQLADALPALDDPNTLLDESLGPTVPLELPSSKHTTFGRAANEEYLTVLSGQMQAKTIQDFAAMALAAERDLSMTPDDFIDALDEKLNNMAKVLDDVDPSTALRFRATLGAQAAGLASTFNTRWLARQRELMQTEHFLSLDPLIKNLFATMAAPTAGDTTSTEQINGMIRTWLRTNAFHGASASANKTHAEYFDKRLEDGAYQLLEEFFGVGSGKAPSMLLTPSDLLKEVAGTTSTIDDPRLTGPVEYLRSRGKSSVQIVNKLNKIITDRITYENMVETRQTTVQTRTFKDLQLQAFNAFIVNDEEALAGVFTEMADLNFVSQEVYDFKKTWLFDGQTNADVYAYHHKQIRRGLFDRDAIMDDFPFGLSKTDTIKLLGEVDTAENARLGRALKLAEVSLGARLLLQVKDKTSPLGIANIAYDKIAAQLRTEFEDALRSGAEFDAVASVQLLLGESAEENRRTMEEADKKNADAAMEAVHALGSHLANDGGEIPLNKAIEWMQDLASRWHDLKRDHFAKKQWPEGVNQLRMQLAALKKRRNSRND